MFEHIPKDSERFQKTRKRIGWAFRWVRLSTGAIRPLDTVTAQINIFMSFGEQECKSFE